MASPARATQPQTVVAWGDTSYGQSNLPADLTNATKIVAGYLSSIALKADGRVAVWGATASGDSTIVPTLNDVMAIDANFGHRLVVRSNGTVVAWGENYYGETNVPVGLNGVVAVASGWYHSLALKNDGTVVGWGGQGSAYNIPAGLKDVTAIAAGVFHSLALKTNGTVVAWGDDYYGDTIVPPGLTNVTAIAAGAYWSVALKSDGTVTAWGNGVPGINSPPGGLWGATAIAANGFNMALKNDGTIVAWGDGWTPQGEILLPPPSGLTNIVAISAGWAHGLALTTSQIPVITAQPKNLAVSAGGNASFSVRAFGPATLSYQWRRNGVDLSGATTSSLSLTNVQSANAGSYTVVVSNSFGTATSSAATLTVNPYLAITAQPQSQSVYAGNNVTLSVSVTGSTPFDFQWTKDNVAITDATNSTLVLSNVQLGDAGAYRVIVTNVANSLTSAAANLTVNPNPAPEIITQPKSQPIFTGALMIFTVAATGSPPLSYQWRKDGTNLVSQTGTNAIIPNIQPGDAGTYTVVVSNSSGAVTSATAVLTVMSSPFVSPPQSSVVSLGGATPPAGLDDIIAIAAGFGQQLAVRSNGTVVCWGNTILPGNPQPPADLSNVVAVASGGIHSIALKRDGTVVGWGHAANPPAGLFGAVAIASGHDGSVALKADGSLVPWGTTGSGPAANSNFVAVTAGSGFYLGLRNDGVVPPLASCCTLPLFNGASNVIGLAGVGLNGLVVLHNNGTLEGWDVGVPEGLSNVVAISPGLALKDDGTVVGLNDTTAPAGLTHVTAISGRVGNGLVLTKWPAILQPPQDLTVNGGEDATFTVVAVGAPTLTYQWQKSGTNLAGATSSSLVLTNAQPADGGSYAVVVGNNAGALTSVPATLTVNSSPAIATPPKSETLLLGMNVTFTVKATGASPLSYQWRKNGTDLSGATSTNLFITNIQLANAANYSAVVTNGYGSVTSAPAVLTVISNSLKQLQPGTVVGLGGVAVPAELTNAVAIAGSSGTQFLAVRSNGTVVCWGQNLFPNNQQPPSDLNNVVAVAAGGIHSAALKSDGTVIGWGVNADPPPGLFGVVAIASGHDHTIAVKADGTTVSWGAIPVNLSGSNFTTVAASANNSVGLRQDGTVAVSGAAAFDFTGASNAVGVAASGYNGVLILHNNGTVQGWNTSMPSGLSNVVAISSGLALKNDGTVVSLNDATLPADLTDVIAICGHANGGLALTTNPPAPVLRAANAGSDLLLSTTVSVPGYALEAADNLAGPYTVIAAYTNAVNTNSLTLPKSDPKKYYRLRKL